MTKYKLEEFKEWLEEKTYRKEGLEPKCWQDIFSFDPDYFQGFIEGYKATAGYFQPYRQIVLKWKNEIDNPQSSNENKNEDLKKTSLTENEKEIIQLTTDIFDFFQEIHGFHSSYDFTWEKLCSVEKCTNLLKGLQLKDNPNLGIGVQRWRGAIRQLKFNLQNAMVEKKQWEEQKQRFEDKINRLEQENERLRNRQLSDNEKAIITIFPKAMAGSSTSLDFRLTAVREFLEQLKKNDLSPQATPNLSAQGISLPECLAANLKEIVRIGDFYFHKESEWEERREELEEQIKELKEQNQQLSSLISPNQPYNSQSLQNEIKRLKIQDLTIQIPLKKQELEQNTNNLKNSLGSSAKYLLDKLLKKQNKLLLNNENNSNKLEEIKQTLKEDLENQTELQNLLNQQKELFNLEKHLESLQTEQVTQIIHNPPRNN